MFRCSRLLVVACVLFAGSAHAASPKKIAVSQVRVIQDVKEGTAAILTEIVTTELATVRDLRVISAAEVGAVIGFENEKRLLGCTSEDSACIAEIGGALGVEYVLLAQVGVIGKLFRFSVILVDTKQGLVVARAAVFSESEAELAEAAQFAARSVLFQLGMAPQPSLPTRRSEVAALPPPPLPEAPAERAGAPPRGAAASTPPSASAASKPAGTAPDLKAKAPRPRPVAALPADPPRPVGPTLLIATGVVAVAGGAVLAGLARHEYQQLEGDRKALSPAEYDAAYAERSGRIERMALGADVAIGVGAASIVGGIVWKALLPDRPAPSLQVKPVASADQAGVLVTARW